MNKNSMAEWREDNALSNMRCIAPVVCSRACNKTLAKYASDPGQSVSVSVSVSVDTG